MHLEFLSGRGSFIPILIALGALAVLAGGFVYPRPFPKRLLALRLAVIAIFFVGAVSLTIVYPVARSTQRTVYLLLDRSVSMDRMAQRAALERELLVRLEDSCESAGITLKTLYFSEEASANAAQIGDRRTTRIAPALALLLESVNENPPTSISRALMISDGAASDEPVIDPYLTALQTRGVAVDAWVLDVEPSASQPKLFFRIPPPPTATVGESVPLEVGLVSQGPTRLTVSDGSRTIAERSLTGNTDVSDITFVPPSPGLRTLTVSAENDHGSSKVRFRMKVLPRLVFEFRGRPTWDARYLLVALNEQPGISVQSRWGTGGSPAAPEATGSARVIVLFGSASPTPQVPMSPTSAGNSSDPRPPNTPVVFWPQMDIAADPSGGGIRWLGRESGSFLPEVWAAGSASPLQPIPARQKISTDLSWKVIERYRDGGVFMAQRIDTAVTPAFLLNGEGLWRWAASRPIQSSAAAGAYQQILDRVISWARHATMPAVEFFALQEMGQIGTPMEFVALFSARPPASPVLKILSEKREDEQTAYGAGTTAVRYSWTPKQAGSYRAQLQTGVEHSFQVSDAPFDLAYPEPRPDILRRIAARTGGKIHTSAGSASPTPQVPMSRISASGAPSADVSDIGPTSADPSSILSNFEQDQQMPAGLEEKRVRVAQSPVFFMLLTMLFAILWTMESRWLR